MNAKHREEKPIMNRLHNSMERCGYTETQLAQRLGIKRQIIHSLLIKENKNSKYYPAISKVLNISLVWLLTGKEVDFDTGKPELFIKSIDLLIYNTKELVDIYCNRLEKHLNGVFCTYMPDGHNPKISQGSEICITKINDTIPAQEGDNFLFFDRTSNNLFSDYIVSNNAELYLKHQNVQFSKQVFDEYNLNLIVGIILGTTWVSKRWIYQ